MVVFVRGRLRLLKCQPIASPLRQHCWLASVPDADITPQDPQAKTVCRYKAHRPRARSTLVPQVRCSSKPRRHASAHKTSPHLTPRSEQKTASSPRPAIEAVEYRVSRIGVELVRSGVA